MFVSHVQLLNHLAEWLAFNWTGPASEHQRVLIYSASSARYTLGNPSLFTFPFTCHLLPAISSREPDPTAHWICVYVHSELYLLSSTFLLVCAFLNFNGHTDNLGVWLTWKSWISTSRCSPRFYIPDRLPRDVAAAITEHTLSTKVLDSDLLNIRNPVSLRPYIANTQPILRENLFLKVG